MLHFPGQLEGEKVIAVFRKIWFTYVKIVFGFAVVIVMPLTLFLLLWFNRYPFAEHSPEALLAACFSSLYFAYGLIFALIAWINDAFDIFIVTNERLIDITQVSFLERTDNSTPLDKIQDVSARMTGFLQTVFNYGTIEVQTAAGDSLFHLDRVHDPDTASRRILDWAHEKRETGTIAC